MHSPPSNLTPPSNPTPVPPLSSPSNPTPPSPLSSPSNPTAEPPLSSPSNPTAPSNLTEELKEERATSDNFLTEEMVIECLSDSDAETVCRICHVSPDRGSGSDLIDIGCGCKSGLGTAHRHCAEAWFKIKGNRCCEICGSNAKNVTGFENQGFMEVWHERRVVLVSNRTGTGQGGTGNGCWRRQPFCNFLMACLVIAFILPWFFRVNMF